MASAYFKQFAIKNNLTIDYGYMYGKYKNFYISLRETLGSTKVLYIITRLGEDKENLKKVLSVFDEVELPKYRITNLERKENYLSFTFELSNDKAHLVSTFLDKFIQSYLDCGLECETICPICNGHLMRDALEAAHYCVNPDCPARVVESMIHFASRDAMNIDSLGDKKIEFLYGIKRKPRLPNFKSTLYF